jgi:solute:Na+ symporter, SSS family
VVFDRQGAAGVNRAQHARTLLAVLALAWVAVSPAAAADTRQWLDWQPLPPLPDPIGVAGPFVGTHRGGLVVAGGANFASADAADIWDVSKCFHAAAFVLARQGAGAVPYAWQTGFALGKPIAYGASASTPAGIVCAGGEDGTQVFADAFLLTWDPAAKKLTHAPLPPLPASSTAGGAAVVGNHVYVVAGQDGLGLDSATDRIWRLAVDAIGTPAARWEPLPAVPGGPRAFAIVAVQHDGFADCLYVIGGRRQKPGTADLAGVEPLADCHEFSPARHAVDPASGWRRRANAPVPLMAGTAAAFRRSYLVVLAAADAESLALVASDPEFAKRHPGFPRQAWAYHTIADTWTSAGETPTCQVTTTAVVFDGGVAIVSGELKPRVRTRDAWQVRERDGPAGREVRDD